jgi:PadR family transcriptional regulator PadR
MFYIVRKITVKGLKMRFLSRPEELVLHAVWQLKENAYCVPIRKHVSQLSGEDWSFGAIYVPLHRLEKKGLVKSFLNDPLPVRGGRSRRIYQITPPGLKALTEVRELHDSMWAGAPEFSSE